MALVQSRVQWRISSWHYDPVVLDLQPPDGTGNGLLRRMR